MTFLRVALTGGIATGKSYVLKRFGQRSLPTVDTDQLSRDVVRRGQPASAEIRRRFGVDVFQPDGELDRARIAERVFRDAAERAALEAIVHPYVRLALEQWFDALESDRQATVGIAAIAPLRDGAGGRLRRRHPAPLRDGAGGCDVAEQLKRLTARDGLSEEDARRRVDAQMPTAEKVAQADFVIRTDGSFESTDAQADAVCERLLATALA